jgi:hypothetical protein
MALQRIAAYLSRPSTRLAFAVALALYVPIAIRHDAWTNPILAAVAVLAVAFSAKWAQTINLVEERILLQRPVVTLGRLTRTFLELPLNLIFLAALTATNLLPRFPHATDLIVAALRVTIASQGFQYLGIRLANRGRGHKHRNVLAALAATAMMIGLAGTSGQAAMLLSTLLWIGTIVAAAETALVVLSDIRAVRARRGGIGLFFGTFNPLHLTHIAMMRRALEERGLERVLVHPTVIPKLHARALQRGEIEIAGREAGMRVYRTTSKADVNVNYFPTGKRFYEHETRDLLIRLALADADIADKVEVLAWGDVYGRDGFYGVIAEVKRRYPGRPLHGIHGSDTGGMWNRAIYDESGWIYPFAVRRRDGLSATAIRNGASGMMTPTSEAIVQELRRGSDTFAIDGRRFTVRDGLLTRQPD